MSTVIRSGCASEIGRCVTYCERGTLHYRALGISDSSFDGSGWFLSQNSHRKQSETDDRDEPYYGFHLESFLEGNCGMRISQSTWFLANPLDIPLSIRAVRGCELPIRNFHAYYDCSHGAKYLLRLQRI